MDVAALLNTSPEAVEQPKHEDSTRIPFRNRTPWDAGGYSLPIHAHHLGLLTDDGFSNESLMDNHIDQCGHKLSDSHSSLSSFASSNSVSHSRLSSMSTVSSLHLPNTLLEAAFTDCETSSHSSKTAAESCSPVSPRIGRSASQSALSPAFYGNGLAAVAEHQFYGSPWKESIDQIFTVAELAKVRSTDCVDGGEEGRLSTTSARPISPSDAILIKRTTPSVNKYLQKTHRVVEREYSHPYKPAKTEENTDKSCEKRPGRLSIQTRRHKRAVSAPDFAGAMGESSQYRYVASTPSSSIAELTPPSSQHPKSSSFATSALCINPDTHPEVIPPYQDQGPCCMYISNCDTGSQLRKAVSHIFGRNKMCTRRIPKHVWVWYCRKHYQRARYRNSKEWARTLQYDLVSRQINRLQEWSEENLRTGEGGVVKDYRLAVRKREQRRLDAQKPKGEREFSESEDDEIGEFPGEAHCNTAVPKWLLNLSGRSHDATKIMEIIDGIQVDLAEQKLSAWPDIEILPNIVLDQDESEMAKGHTKRRALTSAHGRSQSLSSAMRKHEDPMGPWMTRPSDGQNLLGSMSQKRKRSDDREGENDIHSTPQSQRMRIIERQVAIVREGPHTSQRPVFRNFSEHEGTEESFGSTAIISDHRQIATSTHTTPLAAPRPQRYSPRSTAVNIDPGVLLPEQSCPVARRGVHKRSQSDMGGLYNSQAPYRISAKHRHQNAVLVHYDRPAPRRLFSPSASHAPLPHLVRPGQTQRAHSRHRSTPIVPLSIQSRVMSPGGYYTLPRISSPMPALSRDVIDSVRTLDLYSAIP